MYLDFQNGESEYVCKYIDIQYLWYMCSRMECYVLLRQGTHYGSDM